MARPTRRVALAAGLTAALALSIGITSQASAQDYPPAPILQRADAIYFGGNIITMNPAQPTVQAVAVKGTDIVEVGNVGEVRKKRQGPNTSMVNLDGKTMTPGFIDAHSHLAQAGLWARGANLLPPPDGVVDSIDKLKEELVKWSQTDAGKKGKFMMGFGYDASNMGGKPATRDDLDALFPDRPLYLVDQSSHLGTLNTAAMNELGIKDDIADPPGGVYVRDSNGRLTGNLEEAAFFKVQSSVTTPLLLSGAIADFIQSGQEKYIAQGFTTAQEGLATVLDTTTYKTLVEANKMKMDVVAYVGTQFSNALLPVFPNAGANKSSYDRNLLNLPGVKRAPGGYRSGGVKVILDGSPQGRTAWLTQPYLNPPSEEFPAGYQNKTDAQLKTIVQNAFRLGWQLLAHTNGDAAVEQLLRVVKQVQDNPLYGKKDRRVVAIHSQTATEGQVKRMGELGIIPSFFPLHTYYWGDFHRDFTLGEERAQNISPAKWAIENNMMYTAHHDAPVASLRAIDIMASQVNRVTRSSTPENPVVLGPDMRISPMEALKSITINAAYQYFEADTKGSIEKGKFADLVVLDKDPLTIAHEDMKSIQVLETIKRGQTIYTKPAGALDCATTSSCPTN